MSFALRRPSFFRTLAVQQHVIAALILRDVAERVGSGRIGIFFIFAEPLALGVAVTLLHYVMHRGEFAEMVMFYSVSYLCFFMLRSILNRASIVVHGASVLLYHQHVTLLASFVARHIVEFLISITVAAIFVGGAVYVGADFPDSVLKIMGGFLFVLLLTQGMAFLLASLVHSYPALERGSHMISYLFLPLSGAFFILDNLPPMIRDILIWFPWALALDLVHDGLAGDKFKYHWDMSYMLLWVGILHLLGLSALRHTRETLIPD